MMDYLIVIVDDDPMILDSAKGLLSEEYARVRALRSGRELLRFIEKNAPDMILLDILMPELDGFKTFHALRGREKELGRQSAPVIFLTGEKDSLTEQQGLTIGASDYIRKPFHREILLRRVQNAIHNAKTIENLTEEATQDRLTGLLNKAGTGKRLPKLCRAEDGALAILDLDNFKLVNDLHGHEAGDRVLRAFADAMRATAREHDVLCRIGGDEFLAFYRRSLAKSEADALAADLNARLRAACVEMIEGFDIPIGVSVGVVQVPKHGRDYELLFQLADRALYQVKQGGKHGCAVYEPGVTDAGTDDLDAELSRVTRLVRERSRSDAPLWPGQEGFTWVYRFLARYAKDAVTLLFSLAPAEGADVDLAEASARFCDVLGGALRRSDAVLQLRLNQFFLLLPNLTEEQAHAAAARVLTAWEQTAFRDGVSVSYAAAYQDFESRDDRSAAQKTPPRNGAADR